MESAPSELRVEANGLRHRVLVWEPIRALPDDAPVRTIVLVHGFMDAAGSWDLVAPLLAKAGFRVFAPDMRGFGESAQAPIGSYYHFADYVADLAALIEAVAGDQPIGLVGHSMGGTITTLYTGTFPERVARFANLEGLGPPDNPFEVGPTRMRSWIVQTRKARSRSETTAMRPEQALERLAGTHPNIPLDVLRGRIVHLVTAAPTAEGDAGVRWRFDPLHRTVSPTPFFAKSFVEFIKHIRCPVLFVSGGPMGYHPEDEQDRMGAFADLRRAELEGAGHMMHWTQPQELAGLLLEFLSSRC
jgi:pimeloyl-ACP methyl ester carboxylesterase